MTGLGCRAGYCRAGCRSASAQGPAFAERGGIVDLDRHALAVLVRFFPPWVGLVENERFPGAGIKRSENGLRFTRREHITAHVTLRTMMLPRSEPYFEHLPPIFHRLPVHFHNHVSDDRGTNSFVCESEVNVGGIVSLILEDWPNCRAHLLSLHVGGVTGNTQSQESNNGRDHYVVSTGAARVSFSSGTAPIISSVEFLSTRI
jgi:hypothetical protein